MNRERIFSDVMSSLKDRLSLISDLIRHHHNDAVAFLDYPHYYNIGDLLIMRGTEQFFVQHKTNVVYRASVLNFPGFRKRSERKTKPACLSRKTVIVCQGGGNFGDLYPVHQEFREYIVDCYPHNRIIILPQTIHFHDEANLKRTAETFRRHNDVHLFAREENSYAIAKKHFNCEVYLAPDMAHQLWQRNLEQPDRRGEAQKEKLNLIRTDNEQGELPEDVAKESEHFIDWNDLLTADDESYIRRSVALQKWDARLRNTLPAFRFWNRQVMKLEQRAVNLFIDYKRVVTSRLHGHILACLLKKDSLVLDNSYHKNRDYYQTWTHCLAPYCSFWGQA